MKIILLLFTFFFFATQIIPIKYIGYLCHYEVCDISNDDDLDKDDCTIKCKEKIESEVYLNDYLYHYDWVNTTTISGNKYPIYCIEIPKEYIQNIIVPPPNC